MSRGLGWLWVMGTVLWIAAIAWLARANWPTLSLDLSPTDPQVRSALSEAVTAHVLRYAGVALIPPLLALIVLRAAGRP